MKTFLVFSDDARDCCEVAAKSGKYSAVNFRPIQSEESEQEAESLRKICDTNGIELIYTATPSNDHDGGRIMGFCLWQKLHGKNYQIVSDGLKALVTQACADESHCTTSTNWLNRLALEGFKSVFSEEKLIFTDCHR